MQNTELGYREEQITLPSERTPTPQPVPSIPPIFPKPVCSSAAITWEEPHYGSWTSCAWDARAVVHAHAFGAGEVSFSWSVKTMKDAQRVRDAMDLATRALRAVEPGSVVLSAREISELRAILERTCLSELTNWLWSHVLPRELPKKDLPLP